MLTSHWTSLHVPLSAHCTHYRSATSAWQCTSTVAIQCRTPVMTLCTDTGKPTFGICGWLKSLSITTPFTSMVSLSSPPTLPSTLISSKSTSRLSRSATDKTASTAMSANFRPQRFTLPEIRGATPLHKRAWPYLSTSFIAHIRMYINSIYIHTGERPSEVDIGDCWGSLIQNQALHLTLVTWY